MRISVQYDAANDNLYVFSDGNMLERKDDKADFRTITKIQELLAVAKIEDEPIKHILMRAWSRAHDRAFPPPPKSTPAPLPPSALTRPADDSLPNPAADRESLADPNQVELTVSSQVLKDVADYFSSDQDGAPARVTAKTETEQPEQATGSDVNSQVAHYLYRSGLSKMDPED